MVNAPSFTDRGEISDAYKDDSAAAKSDDWTRARSPARQSVVGSARYRSEVSSPFRQLHIERV